MNYQKFQADQLFTGYELLNNSHVLITDQAGTIKEIVLESDAGSNIQKRNGILSPGFINCHCHLELSHLKNVIPPHTGLIEFLCSVVTKRNFDPQVISEEIVKAEKEMYDNGIVAVGDIGYTDERAEENIDLYKQVAESLESKLRTSNIEHRTTIVPHAPYSISPKTFQLINELTKNQIISIHNQEHPAEDELYRTGGGDYLRLFKIFGVDQSPFPVTGKSSIRSCLPHFNNRQTIFLIHNTYMPEEDIVWANNYASENNLKLVYCLCPNANLYIENSLPPMELFIKHNCHLVIGTDSYSSNWQLSIAKEIKAIASMPRFETVASISQVLQWATINGAKALQWDDKLGSFEKGKRPGVILINKDQWTSKRLI